MRITLFKYRQDLKTVNKRRGTRNLCNLDISYRQASRHFTPGSGALSRYGFSARRYG